MLDVFFNNIPRNPHRLLCFKWGKIHKLWGRKSWFLGPFFAQSFGSYWKFPPWQIPSQNYPIPGSLCMSKPPKFIHLIPQMRKKIPWVLHIDLSLWIMTAHPSKFLGFFSQLCCSISFPSALLPQSEFQDEIPELSSAGIKGINLNLVYY